MTVQLFRHTQFDSAVAALTTSLPERLGGFRNYDYRYAWVHDASLSLALLARMGKTAEVKGYLDWLCCLRSTTESPLQVCYRIDGNRHLDEEEISGLRGYENSRPMRRGNCAAKQLQLGSLGFFADCARIYIDHGGEWREQFWQLLKRAADFTCNHWQRRVGTAGKSALRGQSRHVLGCTRTRSLCRQATRPVRGNRPLALSLCT